MGKRVFPTVDLFQPPFPSGKHLYRNFYGNQRFGFQLLLIAECGSFAPGCSFNNQLPCASVSVSALTKVYIQQDCVFFDPIPSELRCARMQVASLRFRAGI